MKNSIFLFVFALCLISAKAKDPLKIVSSKMQKQEKAWNKGSLEGFMSAYWKSDSLVFIGKSGLTYGWQQTLDNYKKSYTSKEEMGTLHFENKIVRMLSDNTIQVIGKWELIRPEAGNLSGHYSLIWQQKNKEWVIISDHSS